MRMVAALTLFGATTLAGTAEAGFFGHRGRTYVYNGHTGYYTGGGGGCVNCGGYAPAGYATRPYATGYGYSNSYAAPTRYYAPTPYPLRPVYAQPRPVYAPQAAGGYSLVPSAIPTVPVMTSPRS
jgi:hypothetical protein